MGKGGVGGWAGGEQAELLAHTGQSEKQAGTRDVGGARQRGHAGLREHDGLRGGEDMRGCVSGQQHARR